MPLLPWLIFFTVVGACVGSFLNVVILRLPEGRSIVHPPSACPGCGHKLAWYENVPVVSWLALRGRCRGCGRWISVQYPLVEAVTALLFGGWFFVAYMTMMRPDFSGPGFGLTAVVYLMHVALAAALLAALVIDARFYIIPLEILWSVGVAAVVLLPAAAWLFPEMAVTLELPPVADGGVRLLPAERLEYVPEPYRYAGVLRAAANTGQTGAVTVCAAPWVGPRAGGMALAALGGLVVAVGLLWRRWLPRSFEAETDERSNGSDPGGNAASAEESSTEAAAVGEDDPHAWLAHPHPRREVGKECLFLLLPVIGAVGGYLATPGQAVWPAWLGVLAGVALGYLAGGAIVWATRILGTLGFGKEAMGLGDVHLLAAAGAICGWRVALLAFFIAPFLGLGWAVGSAGLSKLLDRRVKIIPYGPHLAVAVGIAVVFREPLIAYFGMLLAG